LNIQFINNKLELDIKNSELISNRILIIKNLIPIEYLFKLISINFIPYENRVLIALNEFEEQFFGNHTYFQIYNNILDILKRKFSLNMPTNNSIRYISGPRLDSLIAVNRNEIEKLIVIHELTLMNDRRIIIKNLSEEFNFQLNFNDAIVFKNDKYTTYSMFSNTELKEIMIDFSCDSY
jgi:hypothetical protein